MASTSAIPPLHVETSTLQIHDGVWPSLGESKEESVDEWEMVPPTAVVATTATTRRPTATATLQVTFQDDHDVAVSAPKTKCSSIDMNLPPTRRINPKTLKHAQSSPDLRKFVLEETDDEDSAEESAILVEETMSTASSGVVVVPGSSSVWSVNSSSSSSAWAPTLSFRDVILRNSKNTDTAAKPAAASSSSSSNTGSNSSKPKPRKFAPKIVVVNPTIKRCSKSTGDLLSLATLDEDEEEILGATDADDYYLRKAQGSLGRKNGQKIRPDEAKRLQMTMAKKNQQRQRQRARK